MQRKTNKDGYAGGDGEGQNIPDDDISRRGGFMPRAASSTLDGFGWCSAASARRRANGLAQLPPLSLEASPSQHAETEEARQRRPSKGGDRPYVWPEIRSSAVVAGDRLPVSGAGDRPTARRGPTWELAPPVEEDEGVPPPPVEDKGMSLDLQRHLLDRAARTVPRRSTLATSRRLRLRLRRVAYGWIRCLALVFLPGLNGAWGEPSG
nr:unnamed protein product [Digitaria exilis]